MTDRTTPLYEFCDPEINGFNLKTRKERLENYTKEQIDAGKLDHDVMSNYYRQSIYDNVPFRFRGHEVRIETLIQTHIQAYRRRLYHEITGIFNKETGPYIPVIISEKLTYFLKKAYLGILYRKYPLGLDVDGVDMTESLYFLDPKNTFYRITTEGVLLNVFEIYFKANQIKKYTFRDHSDVLSGINPDIQIRSFFRGPYMRSHDKIMEHEKLYGEIDGSQRKYEFGGKPSKGNKIWHSPNEETTERCMTYVIIRNQSKNCKYTIPDDLLKLLCDNIYPLKINLEHTIVEMDKHPEIYEDSNPFERFDLNHRIKGSRL